MVYYHATATENAESILREGIKKNNFEGVVFLTDDLMAAARFLAIRLCQDITVFEVRLPEEMDERLEESFDHSREFFKCRAYMYPGDIDTEYLGESVRLIPKNKSK